MNSHPICGAHLLLVNRPLHHRKRAHPSNSQLAQCILFPLLPLADHITSKQRPVVSGPLVQDRLNSLWRRTSPWPLSNALLASLVGSPPLFLSHPPLQAPTPYGVPFCVWLTGVFAIKKSPPKQLKDFLQSLFSYHVLLRYAVFHVNSHPIWSVPLTVKRRTPPKQHKAGPPHSVPQRVTSFLATFPLLPSQINSTRQQCVERRTPPFHAWSKTI